MTRRTKKLIKEVKDLTVRSLNPELRPKQKQDLPFLTFAGNAETVDEAADASATHTLILNRRETIEQGQEQGDSAGEASNAFLDFEQEPEQLVFHYNPDYFPTK